MLSPHSTTSEDPGTPKEVFGRFEKCSDCGELSDISGLQPLEGYTCWKCGVTHQAMKHVGNLELEELIGVGGMGSVYRARDTILDRVVALKLLVGDVTLDPARRASLQREAMLTASITHSHVVKIYDAGMVGEICYVTMELLEKGSLAEMIARTGALSERKTVEFGIQLAGGLRAAWDKRLLHRDIKPENILFRDAHTLKVTDFGLAVTAAEAASAGLAMWGSPHYVSPERSANLPEDIRSDIYSVGATLFHALAGRAPFEGEDPQKIATVRANCAAPSVRSFVPQASERITAVLAKALQRRPMDRFQNYDELIKALEECEQASSSGGVKAVAASVAAPGQASKKGSQPLAQPKGTPAQKKSKGPLMALTALVLVAAGGGGAWWYTQHSQPSPAVAPKGEETSFGKYSKPYIEARAALVHGGFATAASAFDKLAKDGSAPGTVHDWARFQEALARLFLNDLPQAKTLFQTITPDPGKTGDGSRAFLAQVARACNSGEVLPKVLGAGLDRDSDQALGLLAYGLVDWQLGDYSDAEAMLRQFRAAHVSGKPWISQIQFLVDPYLTELTDFNGLSTFDRKATRESQMTALKVMRDAVKDFRQDSPLLASYQKKLAELSVGLPNSSGLTNNTNGNGNGAAGPGKNGGMAVQQFIGVWGGGSSVFLDLGTPRKINRWLAGQGTNSRFKPAVNITLFASDDGRTWREIDSYEGEMATIDRTVPEFTTRCVRVTLVEPSTKNDPYNRIGQVELFKGDVKIFRKPHKEANLTHGKKVFDQGNTAVNHTPGEAIDGEPPSTWEAYAAPSWLAVDLGDPQKVNRWVVLHSGATGSASHGRPALHDTVYFKLQASDDGQNWRDIDTVIDNHSDVTDRTVPEFTTRFARIYIMEPSSSGDPRCRIGEFELYGTEEITMGMD